MISKHDIDAMRDEPRDRRTVIVNSDPILKYETPNGAFLPIRSPTGRIVQPPEVQEFEPRYFAPTDIVRELTATDFAVLEQRVLAHMAAPWFMLHGEPSTRRERIRDKIAARVEIVDTGYKTPCHLWTGPTSGAGRGGDYPRMSLDGATVAVHKVAWINEHGAIPPRKQLDHLCCQRRCVRDDHLELTTHKRNQKRRDQRRKG